MTDLTHLSLASLLWDIGKTRRPIWGYSVCLQEFHGKIEQNLKIIPDTPKIKVESIRQIWVKHFHSARSNGNYFETRRNWQRILAIAKFYLKAAQSINPVH